jgi:hypothetical protein
MHSETDRSHSSCALRFMMSLISKPNALIGLPKPHRKNPRSMPPLQAQGWRSPVAFGLECICVCQAASLFKLSSGHLCPASLSSPQLNSGTAPIVSLEYQAGIDEAKNSAGINHAMYEIFGPSNPLRMPLELILQRQSLFLCHSLLPRHRLPPFR